ncbi:MAG: ATP-binding cassette domain-containing protein, partial [Arenicellales bacterium]|nr:ATP-binding cassette domain-containing protein [Arenicellales bacterium]
FGGLAKASAEAIDDAAKRAHVLDFTQGMERGLDTVVGENGLRLSGGQRQRIAIARAILKNAPILILDEATSSLDSESERYVQEAMRAVMVDRMTIVIAHRLSTIESVDRIVVLDQGRIIEEGSHQSLLGAKGHYARLYKLQFAS